MSTSSESQPDRRILGAADVSAIVVNRDAGDALVRCVASLRQAGVKQVIVVDNASGDGSFARLAGIDSEVVLVPSGSNLGYGRGMNLGAKRAGGDVLLVCNPDLVVEDGAIDSMLAALARHEDVAVVGPKVLGADGSRYPSARRFPNLADAAGHAVVGLIRPDNPFTRRYQRADDNMDLECEVDWVSGACMMIRCEAFSSVGGFDPGYFMYVEDLDICWRLHRAGWRVLYSPAAVVTHVGGVSARRHPYKMLTAHHRSTLRFFSKSATGIERALLPVVAVGLGVRLVVAWLLAARESALWFPHRHQRAVE